MDSICHKIILKSQEYYDFNNTYRLNLNKLVYLFSIKNY